MIVTPFTARSTAADVLDGLDLTGRRVLVTGGGSGLGLATSQALRDAGAEVIATSRADFDLADPASINTFTNAWTGPLHAIVANAGIMALPELTRARNGWEMQLATNFLGHFALITGLREHLTADARIVLVSSGAQLNAGLDFDDPQFERRAYDPWVAYAQSKTADVLLAVALSRKWGVTANALAPGRIHTSLQRHLSDATMQAMGAMDQTGELIHPDNFKTPEQGAAASVLLAASPLIDGVTGRYFDEDVQIAGVVPGGTGLHAGVAHWSVDPANADRLWDLAIEALRPSR
ncbi:NAD(P)-dependent dehydrogenase (short-subunit alcohol dehydrogenase family) [Actinoplanes lutulentus]|uniref:NAD(P)-dependent dehydrogenase (Short-subunit alcohol dehydrogenase family) n=1 Tax=Actinoplanes lutulentus TaxID=1287878 RepID=A0A327Z321_9ACTN|nr:SDR family NAD(P)-dependent oxidoreductase [Actinoplanes lutulentus]MBB2943821.1 NAD(P)-dependent dehydrogenase (short-subunit alcohol dehydrogenase family) [Actinoplanes lutulentus]RAK29363.1 NAD(P)-dependent dehydrogenase (short-subunit alcohol dehydrogenase family) [Actinoplanes lutulentus]